ncbi:MAG: hydrogenase formation protein HypD, partial [Candidatus Marinimicrobia bacterium]|nr:hydrogenase formation protein HypD [Candidatus Neomarinimicrobiota bacterium]
VIFTSFGDMLRVPGSHVDLLTLRSRGADVRTVYSPLESLKMARENPDKEVVFLAIGFETTVPGNAMAVLQAHKEGLSNFSELISQVRVPPAMEVILSAEDNRVDAFLAAGHVCAVMGWWEYDSIAEKYKTPIAITGFEAIDVLEGIFRAVTQLEKGEYKVENAYKRAVTREGSLPAQKVMNEIFENSDQKWRGIGVIPGSGLALREKYAAFDADKKFSVQDIVTEESPLCISGLILQGKKKPAECPAFGKECTPRKPLGATMVSDEGTCAAYFRHKRLS